MSSSNKMTTTVYTTMSQNIVNFCILVAHPNGPHISGHGVIVWDRTPNKKSGYYREENQRFERRYLESSVESTLSEIRNPFLYGSVFLLLIRCPVLYSI